MRGNLIEEVRRSSAGRERETIQKWLNEGLQAESRWRVGLCSMKLSGCSQTSTSRPAGGAHKDGNFTNHTAGSVNKSANEFAVSVHAEQRIAGSRWSWRVRLAVRLRGGRWVVRLAWASLVGNRLSADSFVLLVRELREFEKRENRLVESSFPKKLKLGDEVCLKSKTFDFSFEEFFNSKVSIFQEM